MNSRPCFGLKAQSSMPGRVCAFCSPSYAKKLGDYLDIHRDSVGIKPDACEYLDVTDLEEKLAGDKIEQALHLYQGEFLQGFHVQNSTEFEHWLQMQQERLRAQMTGGLHRAVTRAVETGDYGKGDMLVHRLLEVEPFDETAYHHSILLLGLEGRRTEALAQYEKCRDTLQKELGVEPSEELQELHTRIQRGDTPSSLMPPLPENNLPAAQTSFVGRETELTGICTMVRDPACRLLSLVGLGGSGKTRLAIQAASEVLRCFPDGVYFVPLESADSADYLIPAIARALQFTLDSLINGADLRTQILDYLRKKSILLVLDGCEYIAGNIGDLPAILEKAPNVRVLATSRQRLRLRSERVFPIEGMEMPQTGEEISSVGMEAVRLFLERTEQAGASLQLSAADIEPIVRICRMVDGMPLGIELAAAWTPVLSPKEIAEATSKSFDFLSATMCDIPERHRSLRAVFESSWSLLTDELREAFSKLAIFRGGFILEAAEEVAGVSLGQLSALLNRSLLHRTSAGRFWIHSLLQQYAAEKLGVQDALERQIQDRFCRYYVNLVTQRETDLMGPRMLQVRDEIRLEMDNIRAAVHCASLHWPEQTARDMIISLVCFYAIHGWQEGVIAFRDLAQTRKDALLERRTRDPSKDPVFLSARIHQAFYQCNLGLINESEAISRECLEDLHQPGMERELSVCLQNLGVNASYRGEYEDAQELLEEAIVIGKKYDHIMWPTYLFWLGNLYFQIGEYEQGLLTLQKSYDLFDRKGTLWGTAFALSKIAMAEDGLEEHARAKEHHQEALSEFDRLESMAGKAYALSRMSMSAYFLEQYQEAAQLAQQGYEAFDEIGHCWGICTSLCGLGFAQIGLGEREKAKAYFMQALRESRSDQIVPQSLYALIGFACCLAQEGKEEKALEVIRYVKKHPETPSIYLKQAVRWIGNWEKTSSRYSKQKAGLGDEIETLDAVVKRMLD
jgi:tetratricopeptide (TPR) repeat protein